MMATVTAMAPTVSPSPSVGFGPQYQTSSNVSGNISNAAPQNANGGKTPEPTPIWQLEMLMEKLRSCSTKSWTDSAKNAKVAFSVDKKVVMDIHEKHQLQKCLDSIQKSLKVSSLADMFERLESISRQLNLKFLISNSNSTDCVISSDMFLVEISMDMKAVVKEVKITHQSDNESQPCVELVDLLNKGDFSGLSNHLEGLMSIYLLVGEKKLKSKAWVALSSLESDLSQLAQLQSAITDTSNLVHKSPVGVVQLRRGGIPMRLTYFISPYDLLDERKGGLVPLTVDTIISSNLGHHVSITIVPSIAHKVQTQSLISVSRSPDGKNLPSFSALSPTNSITLPAVFSLQLPSPIPVSLTILKQIQQITGIDCGDLSETFPLLSLIIKSASDNQLDCHNNKGLFVTLPDQQHCYFLTSPNDLQGITLSNIPFTHPTHVPQVLVLLRQQVLFNTLFHSCVRLKSRHDLESAITFEVSAFSIQHLSVMFEHPAEESMATVEFDLADISNIRCKLFTVSSESTFCSEDYASKVIQRCLSIPVTMRAVIKKTQSKKQSICHQGNADVIVSLGQFPPTDQNQNNKIIPDLESSHTTIKSEPQSCVLNSNSSFQVYNVSQCNNPAGTESMSFGADKLSSGLEVLMQAGGEAPTSVLLSLMSEQAKQKKIRKRKACELQSIDSPISSPNLLESEEDSHQGTSPPRTIDTSIKFPDNSNAVKKEKNEIILDMTLSSPNPSISEHYFLGEGLSKGSEGNAPSSIALGADSLDMDAVEGIFTPAGLTVIPTKSNVGLTMVPDKKEKKLPKLKLDSNSFSLLGDNQQGSPVLVEFSDKSSLSALSITPISSSPSHHQLEHNPINPSLLGLGLEKRPGIEIIPLPGNGSDDYFEDKKKEIDRFKKEGRKLDEIDKKREGKKKRKRDDNLQPDKPSKMPNISIASTNMGPPLHLMGRAFEKSPTSKPLTISLKTQGSTSPVYHPKHESLVSRGNSRPTTPSPTSSLSPKQGLNIVSSGGIPNSNSRASSSSPKNMKPYSISSPKGGLTVTKSLSPKLPQSSGKPSISTLKSTSPPLVKTASPPKHKSKKISSSDRISSQAVGVKLKALGGNTARSGSESPVQTTGPPSPDCSIKHGNQYSGSNQNQSAPNKSPLRNKKGSLSAVIDKLRLGQHSESGNCPEKSKEKKDRRSPDRSLSNSSSRDAKDKTSGDCKKAEFVVKPSSQGLKLTVTKTKSTDGTTKLTSSVKTTFGKDRTGLKAGVTSGPASKKLNLSKGNEGGLGSSHSKSGGIFSNASIRPKPSSPKLSGEPRPKDKIKSDKNKSKPGGIMKEDKMKLETDAEKTVTKLLQSWTEASGEQRALAKYKIPKLEPKPDGDIPKTVKGEGPKPGTIIVRSDPNKKNDLQEKLEDKAKGLERSKTTPVLAPQNTNRTSAPTQPINPTIITSPKSGARPSSPKHSSVNINTPFRTVSPSVNSAARNEIKGERSMAMSSQPLNLTLHSIADDASVPESAENNSHHDNSMKCSAEINEPYFHSSNNISSTTFIDSKANDKLVPKCATSTSAKPVVSSVETNITNSDSNRPTKMVKSLNLASPESPDSCADEEGLVIDVENSISLSDDASPKQNCESNSQPSVPPRPSSRPSSQPSLSCQSVMSPSVSVHIVKSPAPVQSPLTLVSPRSAQASPFVIDDELMDEALMLSK